MVSLPAAFHFKGCKGKKSSRVTLWFFHGSCCYTQGRDELNTELEIALMSDVLFGHLNLPLKQLLNPVWFLFFYLGGRGQVQLRFTTASTALVSFTRQSSNVRGRQILQDSTSSDVLLGPSSERCLKESMASLSAVWVPLNSPHWFYHCFNLIRGDKVVYTLSCSRP